VNILLGVTGGISAYKSAELLRLMKKSGFEVRVVMTKAAQEFITPLTFQALSGQPVYTDLFAGDAASGMDHIALARWADFLLIAPASADCLARLAEGRANDLLSTLCAACQAPIALAPAMNQQMWQNQSTQANVATLQQRQFIFFGPGVGEQACGENGPGRLLEPLELCNALKAQFQLPGLVGKKIVITAGATQEAIDPIRYLTNHSTGRMGHCIADAAVRAGANVTLVSAAKTQTTRKSVKLIKVITALEMYDAVIHEIDTADIFIATAAVADYRPKNISQEKIKKTEGELTLILERNPDILSMVSHLNNRPYCVGFSAETHKVVQHAKKKLIDKNLDMIIANQVGADSGFGDGKTSVTFLKRDGACKAVVDIDKSTLAHQIIEVISNEVVSSKAT
jgi:phosphopantothenoylcysteine decarboxylase / phosphopantothenate---cysteine ligase